MEWFEQNGWAAWLAVALVLAGVEAASADLIFIMLAGGALAGMVVGLFPVSLAVQIVAACATALVLLVAVRPVLKRRLIDGTPGAQLGVETYAGRSAVVVEPVDEHDGRVRFDGEIWSARADDTSRSTPLPLPVGATVTIVRVDGATLVVEGRAGIQDEIRPLDS